MSCIAIIVISGVDSGLLCGGAGLKLFAEGV